MQLNENYTPSYAQNAIDIQIQSLAKHGVKSSEPAPPNPAIALWLQACLLAGQVVQLCRWVATILPR